MSADDFDDRAWAAWVELHPYDDDPNDPDLRPDIESTFAYTFHRIDLMWRDLGLWDVVGQTADQINELILRRMGHIDDEGDE